MVSELADFAVYTPLARRRFVLALVASCAAGALVDSVLFLWLAFGSTDHMVGQVIGKAYAVLAFVGIRAMAWTPPAGGDNLAGADLEAHAAAWRAWTKRTGRGLPRPGDEKRR